VALASLTQGASRLAKLGLLYKKGHLLENYVERLAREGAKIGLLLWSAMPLGLARGRVRKRSAHRDRPALNEVRQSTSPKRSPLGTTRTLPIVALMASNGKGLRCLLPNGVKGRLDRPNPLEQPDRTCPQEKKLQSRTS